MVAAFFYNIPNSWLLFLFIVVLTSLSLIGLFTFTILASRGFNETFNNESSGIYIGIVSVAIGIIIAFIITNEWQTFHEAEINMSLEANIIYILYVTVEQLENSQAIQELIKTYLCSIINIEFPALQNRTTAHDEFIVDTLATVIYRYNPNPNRSNQRILYEKSVDLFNQAMILRTQRLETAFSGIANELWWVMILGYILVVILSWFITGSITFRAIMTSIISILYASLLFLAVAIDYTFQGDLGLAPVPFELVATQIEATCSQMSIITDKEYNSEDKN